MSADTVVITVGQVHTDIIKKINSATLTAISLYTMHSQQSGTHQESSPHRANYKRKGWDPWIEKYTVSS